MTADTPIEQPATAAEETEEAPPPEPAEMQLRLDPEERLEPVLSVRPRRTRRARIARKALAIATHLGMIVSATIIFLVALAFVLDDLEPTRSPSQSASMRY